ncbi:unnamed protein product [Darwinula stevensoni]|uniref:E3 ubiquitin-protein ligase CHFR n=1 Tax=Darwinula stevensoni TaxID=69355 RepID=A0A7R9A086_9CRUS|nr:unnamed protein product [Darwinula stevensoni]CAG0880505.1 unnamed protein product [Darwinula stevensoni]
MKVWGELEVLDAEHLQGNCAKHYPLMEEKREISIGRSSDCDIVVDNRLVSSKHCTVKKIGESVHVHDHSTNGTVVNGRYLVKSGGCHLLKHGDVIHVVHHRPGKGGAKSHEVVPGPRTRFRKLIVPVGRSWEMRPVGAWHEAVRAGCASCRERLADVRFQIGLVGFPRVESPTPTPLGEGEGKESLPVVIDLTDTPLKMEPAASLAASLPANGETAEGASSSATSQAQQKKRTSRPSRGTKRVGSVSSPSPGVKKPRKRVARRKLTEDVTNGKESGSSSGNGIQEKEGGGGTSVDDDLAAGPSTSGAASTSSFTGDLLANLTCSICTEVMHQCVAVQPCMHSFCGGCYSKWMAKSNQCPQCRAKVNAVARNHMMQNLVDLFLKENPGFKRAKEDIEDLEKSNKINQQVNSKVPLNWPILHQVKVKKNGRGKKRGGILEEVVGEEEVSDVDSSDGSSARHIIGTFFASLERRMSFLTGLFRQLWAPTSVLQIRFILCATVACERCQIVSGIAKLTHPSLSRNVGSKCGNFFCHLYLNPCTKQECNGCLNKLRDMNFGDKVYDRWLLDNTYESQVLKEYLQSKNMSWHNVLQICCDLLEEGSITLPELAGILPDSILCYRCALQAFQSMVYQYRVRLTREDLPAEVTSRQNCYWGRNCRTQLHQPHHASAQKLKEVWIEKSLNVDKKRQQVRLPGAMPVQFDLQIPLNKLLVRQLSPSNC